MDRRCPLRLILRATIESFGDRARKGLRQIDGVGYPHPLAPIPDGSHHRARLHDCLLGRFLEELLRNAQTNDTLRRGYARPGFSAAEKRQLGKRELRNLGKLPLKRKPVER